MKWMSAETQKPSRDWKGGEAILFCAIFRAKKNGAKAEPCKAR